MMKTANGVSISWGLLKSVTMVFWSVSLVFLFCEFSENLTKQFDMFNDTLGQSKWYQLSLPMQRMLVIVIANTQYPTHIRGFGNLFWRREAFKKVMKSVNFD